MTLKSSFWPPLISKLHFQRKFTLPCQTFFIASALGRLMVKKVQNCLRWFYGRQKIGQIFQLRSAIWQTKHFINVTLFCLARKRVGLVFDQFGGKIAVWVNLFFSWANFLNFTTLWVIFKQILFTLSKFYLLWAIFLKPSGHPVLETKKKKPRTNVALDVSI